MGFHAAGSADHNEPARSACVGLAAASLPAAAVLSPPAGPRDAQPTAVWPTGEPRHRERPPRCRPDEVHLATHLGVKRRPLMRPLMDRQPADRQRWFRIWASSTAICTTVVCIRSSSLPDTILVHERRAAVRTRDGSFPDLAPLNHHWPLDPLSPLRSASGLSTAPRMIIVLVCSLAQPNVRPCLTSPHLSQP